MTHLSQLLSISALFLFLAGCSNESTKPETLVIDYDEAEMEQAMVTARERVGEFIETLEAGDADSFSVKVPITDDNGTQHFWITEVKFDEGKFKGVIGNDPGVVENVTFGQEWETAQSGISDWMFVRGEKIHGGFTIDPLLNSYPKEDGDALRAKLVR